MTVNKEILELTETLAGLKTASDLIVKEIIKAQLELNEFAKNLITAYERFPHKYALPIIKRNDQWGQVFDPLDKEINVEFSFDRIYNEYVYLEASYCYDRWEPSFAEITYRVPVEIFDYLSSHDYFVFEYFKNGLHKKDEFGFLVGATTEEILENKIELYLGSSQDAKIAEPGLVHWIIKKIEDEKGAKDD
jgi:hypothetical protein